MIKEKLKKVTNNIELILLVLILIVSAFRIRYDSFNESFLIATNAIMIIYFAVHIIIKNPIKIIKSKMDIFAMVFVLATATPVIFNTYISLSATTLSMMSYITLFWIYILAREMSSKNNKGISWTSNIVIFTAIIFIIAGIENLTTNAIFNAFGINYIINGEDRLVSIFGNPNTFAAFIAFAYFISADRMLNSKSEKGKILYATANTILILGLVLTYSKAMYIIFAMMFIIYMFILKNKTKNTTIALNVITSFVMAVIYTYTFLKLDAQEAYLAILVLSILGTAIAVVVNILNIKIEEYLEKIKLKSIAIGIAILAVVGAIWIAIELNMGKEFVVFGENSTATYNAKKIKNIQPNQKYVFSFDMDADCNLAGDYIKDLFTINIIQRDNKNIEITNTEERFENFSGIKNIEIETTENTAEIKIEFKVKYKHIYKEWTINHLKVNDKEVILEYKHLPTKLVEKISDISLNYKTAQERIQFIKDGFKLIGQNFLTGIGDSGWQFKYKEVQDYGYISNDTHSYITQVWLEYGIVSILALMGIVVLVVRNKTINTGWKLAIITLLIHSTIDSDMCFLYMKILLFIGLGILALKQNEKENKAKLYSNIIAIAFCIGIIVITINPKVYDKRIPVNELEESKIGMYINSDEYKQINSKLIKEYDKLSKYERGNSQLLSYEFKKVQYSISSQENLEEAIKEFYEKMLVYKSSVKYDTSKIIEKSYYINSVLKALEDINNPKIYPWIMKLAQITIDDFEETKTILEKVITSKYNDDTAKSDYSTYINNYIYAIGMSKQYVLGVGIINTTEKDFMQYINDDAVEVKNKKDIVIYHTHTTEAYAGKYEETEYGKTLDENYNIINVGKAFSKTLEDKGFNVTHIQKYHDLEGINGAYNRSFESAQAEVKQKNVDIVFDIHRDAYMGNSSKKNYNEINGKKTAKMRFIIAIGHEGWENNLKWAIELQKKADELYPGLFQPMYLYNGNYNQDASKYATLVEVGNEVNTIEEATQSLEYFADVISEVMK